MEKESNLTQLEQLIEQWTRAEVMARLGHINRPKACDYYSIMLDKIDEIRRLLYGTDDLTELGHRWKLPIDP